MTEKNIFLYKLFLSLNILDFSIFLRKIATAPEKSYSLFFSKPPLKIEVLPSLPFWKFGRRFNPHPMQKDGVGVGGGGGGVGRVHTMSDELYAIITWLMSKCLWSGWKWIVNVCERKTSQKNNSDAQIILLYQSLVWLLETNCSKTESKMFDKFV